MRRAGWLLVVAGLLALLAGTAHGMDEEADQADVSVEGEDGEETTEAPGKVTLNLFDESTDQEEILEKFIPTGKWQTVKKGQPLPKGLHYRLNLASGTTEAKLLDDTDESSKHKGAYKAPTSSLVTTEAEGSESASPEKARSADSARLRRMRKVMAQAKQELDGKEADKLKYWTDGNKEGMLKLKGQAFSRDELKDALKKFKIRDDDVKKEATTEKTQFRSMKDIKKEFAEMQMGIKTDAEVITDLLVRYRDPHLTDTARTSLLAELEYYLHQIDNAMTFVDLGGLQLVIQDLNNTSQSVRQEAASVIGSATQNNAHVKIDLLELGGVHKLVRALATETSAGVRGRVLFALSCTLRNFPAAQKSFVDNGGAHSLTAALTQTASPRLRLKAVTLAVDLLQEQLQNLNGEPSEFLKAQRYEEILLQEALLEQGWCALVPTLLEYPDHDAREKILTAMTLLLPSCPASDFLPARGRLGRLHAEYRRLADKEMAEEGVAGYFAGVLKLVSDLMQKIEEDSGSTATRREEL